MPSLLAEDHQRKNHQQARHHHEMRFFFFFFYKNTYNFTAGEMLALHMEKRTTCGNGARSSPREGFQFEIINTASDRSHLAGELTLGSVERQTTE